MLNSFVYRLGEDYLLSGNYRSVAEIGVACGDSAARGVRGGYRRNSRTLVPEKGTRAPIDIFVSFAIISFTCVFNTPSALLVTEWSFLFVSPQLFDTSRLSRYKSELQATYRSKKLFKKLFIIKFF